MMSRKHIFIPLGLFVLASLLGVFIFTFARADSDHSNHIQHGALPEASASSNTAFNSIVEETRVSPSDALGLQTTAWPGDILSTGDLTIHPPREGSIEQWHVRIGEYVNKGQLLATLSTPPASSERAMALADTKAMILKSQVNAGATETLIQESKKNLEAYRDSLRKAQEAKIADFQDGATRSTKNLPSSQGVAATKQIALRAMLQQMIERHLRMIAKNFVNPEYVTGGITYKSSIGAYHGQVLYDFDALTLSLLKVIKDGTAVPEDLTVLYFQSLQQLILASSPSEDISQDELLTLKNMVSEDRLMILDAFAELKNMVAEVNVEYAEKIAELNSKIAELDKELAMAKGEVEAAEVAYRELTDRLNAVHVTAPRSGFITGIYEDIGHFVNPGMTVASMSTQKNQELYIRFRIPNNAKLPKAGDLIRVNRPGFAFDEVEAKIIGVGTTLDSSGSYLADATFLNPPAWPPHASVRVHLASEHARQTILVPLTAVLREKDVNRMWTITTRNTLNLTRVTTDRIIGDKVEIIEGLTPGTKFVAIPHSNLREGMSLEDVISQSSPTSQSSETTHTQSENANAHSGHIHEE